MDRRSLLVGGLAGLAVGVGVTWWARSVPEPASETEPPATPPANAGPPVDPTAPPPPPKLGPQPPDGRIASFAQQGEDLAIVSVLQHLKIERPTYLDIGAFHPSIGSNTYLLYLSGGHGVLVEPNPHMAKLLTGLRPRDTVLTAGIGTGEAHEADYYLIRDRPQLNTFSREQVDRYVAEGGPQVLEKTMKMKLLPIDDVIAEHFDGAPDVLSVDVEGLDLQILRTLSFDKFRPAVICVETLRYGTTEQVDEVTQLLTEHGYVPRGGTFVNTIFVDGQRLRGAAPSPQ